jgi:hypothetical protein
MGYFFAGFAVGTIFGVVTAALCIAAGNDHE